MGQLWVPLGRLGGALGGLEQLNLVFARKTKGTGNQKANPRSTREAPRRHQGGTKEAPRRHQGGTREAPRRNLHISMGPRAAFKTYKVLEHITVVGQGLI